ncbi:hypothetical protein Mal52_13730 [Symmachiella dynata]|uniref:Uncharacterized protein n=1 Tax=Symmachiella dynata TaxID=2527995 RepID=A0A517ZK74_9PLAN|nr:hypothetical protein [Symmachiella dynata]QDU42904.1 hypothetical protein Mal52_13730 [Symmachiella dynata]
MAIVKHYRHTETGHEYSFRFEKHGETWKVFCLKHPPNPHKGSSVVTHIFSDGRLCITHPPQSAEQAAAAAFRWMHGYSTFVLSGKFPNDACRAVVPDYNDAPEWNSG